jgi:hypothetical protein
VAYAPKSSSSNIACHRPCRSKRIENNPALVLNLYATIGFSTALSGGVDCDPRAAYHRQSVTLSMPAARISRARLTPRASTARAAGASHSGRRAACGGFGLASAGRFSLRDLVHAGSLFAWPLTNP